MTEAAERGRSLVELWDDLAGVAGSDRLFRTLRLARPTRLDLRAGLRETDAAPCLVAAAGGADTARIVSFETSGLRLARYPGDEGVLVVLSLEEPGRRDLFARVCEDVLASILSAENAGEPDLLGGLAERLSAWRAFLRDQTGGLARSEVVGLMGELIVLGRLLERSCPEALQTWTAPDDGLHDFQQGGRALEVKTSLGAARRFSASSLDQLDEAGLAALHVAHVRLVEQPDGETLAGIITGLETRFADERDRRAFSNALLRRGLGPVGDDDGSLKARCLGIEFYRITGDFPRLTRSRVPLGIEDARYDIEVRTLVPFQVDAELALDGMGTGPDG